MRKTPELLFREEITFEGGVPEGSSRLVYPDGSVEERTFRFLSSPESPQNHIMNVTEEDSKRGRQR